MTSSGIVRWYANKPAFETSDVSIHGIGYRELHPVFLVDRGQNIHSDYLFIHFPGEVMLRDFDDSSNEPVRVPADTMIIWPPEGPNYYGRSDEPWEHSWLHCGGAAVERLLQAYDVPIGRAFSFPNADYWRSMVWDIYEELTQFSRPDPQVVLWNLKIFFSRLRRYRLAEDDYHCVPARFLALKSDLENHYREPRTINSYARQANCSPAHLTRKFKQYFGIGIQDYLMEVRMRHALYLLQDKGWNVSEIAEQVGYASIFSFSKQFKKRFGSSPTAMRRKIESASTRGEFSDALKSTGNSTL